MPTSKYTVSFAPQLDHISKYKWIILNFISIFIIIILSHRNIFAYSNNMNASVVIGQTNFTSNSGGLAANKFAATNIRGLFVDPLGRLYVSDTNNNRVLIWNKIPTENGVSADLVLGQADFVSGAANRGGSLNANTLSAPRGIWSDGNKLIIVDSANDRILIWNTFPTQNGQDANFAIGAPNLNSNPSDVCNSSTFSDPFGITVYNNKIYIADRAYNRILVWNRIPNESGLAADLVVGQTDFNTCTAGSISNTSLSDPRSVLIDKNGKMFINDRGRQRLLIWNNVPISNNAPADIVVGQPDFSSSGIHTTADGLTSFVGMYSSGDRLFINDINRLLIYNSIPTANGVSADIVLGQSDFTSNNANAGGSTSASSLSQSHYSIEYNDKLLVLDEFNARVLIFNNVIQGPGISLSDSPQIREGGLLRLKGIAKVENPYSIRLLQYSINGGGFTNAISTDGNFNSSMEEFYFDFNTRSNNYTEDGYTVRIKSTNNNADITDNLFYFSPFVIDSPSNNAYSTNVLPTFEFSINKGRVQDLFSSLSKFQVVINKDNKGWQTYIENIPVSYEATKNNNNVLKADTDNDGNGLYENKKIWVSYSDNNSTIKVYSKSVDSDGNSSNKYFEDGGRQLSPGTYQWKIVAIDKTGHSQETGARYLRINTKHSSASNIFFPLSILHISGVGYLNISTINPSDVKSLYTTFSRNPIFYGIANVNSKVTLELIDELCKRKGENDCIKTYNTIANADSRFGINVPKNSLINGRVYNIRIFVELENNYNELPTFNIKVQ